MVVHTGKFGNFTTDTWPAMLEAAGVPDSAQILRTILKSGYAKVHTIQHNEPHHHEIVSGTWSNNLLCVRL